MRLREAGVPRPTVPLRTAILALCILAMLTARRTGLEGLAAPVGSGLAERHMHAPSLVVDVRVPAAGFVVHR